MALFNFGMNDSTNIGRAAATPNSPDSNEPIVGASDPQKSEEPEKSAFDKLNELLYLKKKVGKMAILILTKVILNHLLILLSSLRILKQYRS